jgi:hypothetical protein
MIVNAASKRTSTASASASFLARTMPLSRASLPCSAKQRPTTFCWYLAARFPKKTLLHSGNSALLPSLAPALRWTKPLISFAQTPSPASFDAKRPELARSQPCSPKKTAKTGGSSVSLLGLCRRTPCFIGVSRHKTPMFHVEHS